MARSAPKISFSVTSVNYGTIDVGATSAMQLYNVFSAGRSSHVTEAIHMSVSMKEGTNASEVRTESWIWVSTAAGSATGKRLGSVSTGPEETLNSVIAGRSLPASMVSVNVATKVIVPAGAATAGAVTFYLHHRYQYTGDDDDN